MDMSACPRVSAETGHVRPPRLPLGADTRTSDTDIEGSESDPSAERVAEIRARKTDRQRRRTELAEARQYGLRRRHANKLRHLNRKETDPS